MAAADNYEAGRSPRTLTVLLAIFAFILEVVLMPVAAAASGRSCPNPPTIKNIDLQAYAGRWYESGTSARFKFQRENGLICNQANYTVIPSQNATSGAATVAVVNSGQLVANFFVVRAVRNIASASRQICGNQCALRQQLHRIEEAKAIIHAAGAQINKTYPNQATAVFQASEPIARAKDKIEKLRGKISDSVAVIQMNTGRLSQLSAPLRQLWLTTNGTAARIHDMAEKIEAQTMTMRNATAEILMRTSWVEQHDNTSEIADAVRRISTSTALIVNASREIDQIATGIQSSSIEVQESSETAAIGDGQLPGNGTRIWVRGTAVQDAEDPGKLTVDFDFFGPAPDAPNYWIIGLEGEAAIGYTAALIYSCSQDEQTGPQEDVFIISRRPRVDISVVQKFRRILAKNEIQMRCDNPFIDTVQDEARCGYSVTALG